MKNLWFPRTQGHDRYADTVPDFYSSGSWLDDQRYLDTQSGYNYGALLTEFEWETGQKPTQRERTAVMRSMLMTQTWLLNLIHRKEVKS